VCLGCETDFVAKTEGFQALANQIAATALEHLPADVAALMDIKAGDFTVGDLISQQTGKTGEKHQIPCYEKLEAAQLVPYNHMTGKDSALVAFSKAVDVQVGKDIAMQVTAMKPVSVSKADCPQSVVDKELQIAREQMKLDQKLANKSPNMLEGIAQGKLNKFFKESTLLAQDFIKDGALTVEAYLKNADKDLTVISFRRFSLND
jgi:elongation factor Ts